MSSESPERTAVELRFLDAELVGRAADGDAAACRALVDQHLARTVGFAYRLLQDAAEAEDVAQEAFLRLWKAAPAWRPDARVGTWLYRVTRNLCVDRMRRRRGEPLDGVPEPVDEAIDAAAEIHATQVAGAVQLALGALPERQRAAIVLVHFEEETNIAAAETMEVSVEALESLLSRGRRTLRRLLAEQRVDLLEDL